MNKILRNSILAGIFVLPFISLIVSSSMLFPFITGKNFAFRIIVEIVFALWVTLALRDKEYRPKFSWILGVFLIFVAFVALADAFGVNPAKSFWSNFERMEGFLAIVHLLLYFIVVSTMLKTRELWNWFMGTWVGVSVIMCIFGLYQLGGKAVINQGGTRVDGTLGNATYLAVFLLFNIFFLTFLFIRSKNKSNTTWFYVPTVLLQLIILYYTGTRGVVLGLFGGILVIVFLTLFFDKDKHDKRLRKISAGVLIALAVLVGSFYLARNTSFVMNSNVLARFASISPSDIKTQGRYFIWPMAVKGALERPILGWGQEGFNYIFNKDYNPKMYAQEQWFDRAHSTPIDWLVAGGILGLVSYLSLFVFALFYMWKKSEGLSFLDKGLITGLLAAYFFQNIFVFDNLLGYVLFVSTIAYIHTMSSRGISWPKMLSHKGAQSTISAVFIVLILLSLYFFNIQPIRASQTLIDALASSHSGANATTIGLFEKAISLSPMGRPEVREQLVNSAGDFLKPEVSPDIKSRYIELTKKEYEKQFAGTRDDTRYYQIFGLFLRNIGENEEALKMFERAVSLSPRKQSVWYDVGSTKINKGDFDGAFQALKIAYELDLTNNMAKMFYAIGALYDKKPEIVGELLNSLPRDQVLYDERLVSALVNLNQYQELVKIFSARIAEGHDEIQNNISLAISYLRMEQRQKAIEILQSFILRNPEHKAEIEPNIKLIEEGKNF
jgi:O-antigen ligase